MGQPVPRQHPPLLVQVAFEPTHLAADALRGAYRTLVATPARKTGRPVVVAPQHQRPQRVEGTER